MQALDLLLETVCFEAIDHVVFAHDPKSHRANISVHPPLHVAIANVHRSYHDSNSCLISNMLQAL